jgi:nicotinate-nucleotide pyrophosphorylase (carboxylating)
MTPTSTSHAHPPLTPSRADESAHRRELLLPADPARDAVAAALAEDVSDDDVTTRWSVPEAHWSRADIVMKQDAVVAGLPVAAMVMGRVDDRIEVEQLASDGDRVRAGQAVMRLAGPTRSLLTGERTALNFLQRMSGVASLTSAFVRAVEGWPVRVLDTRKTAPGLRALDKYAVAAGGGHNHRWNLSAMVLLKENHLAAAGGVSAAVAAVREGMAAEGRHVRIALEVQDVEEAEVALGTGIQWIMLDNFALPDIAAVVGIRQDLRRQDVLLEASGNVSLTTVHAIAATGVDLISVGALTHSAPAVDLTMLLHRGE